MYKEILGWKDIDSKAVLDAYNSGLNVRMVAKKFGIVNSCAIYHLNKMGYKPHSSENIRESLAVAIDALQRLKPNPVAQEALTEIYQLIK